MAVTGSSWVYTKYPRIYLLASLINADFHAVGEEDKAMLLGQEVDKMIGRINDNWKLAKASGSRLARTKIRESSDEDGLFSFWQLLDAGHGQAIVVATCGSGAYPVGQLHQLTMNPAGYLCVSTTTVLGTSGIAPREQPPASRLEARPPGASKAAHAPP